jgi:DNA repair and recombination RAD54-like protein
MFVRYGMSNIFKIVYIEPQNKENINLDGYLIADYSNKWLWLKSLDKTTLRRGQVSDAIMDSLVLNAEFTLAGYSIRIVQAGNRKRASGNENGKRTHESPFSSSSDRAAAPSLLEELEPKRLNLGSVTSKGKGNEKDAGEYEDKFKAKESKVQLDPVVKNLLREHQIVATEFLLKILAPPSPCSSNLSSSSSQSSKQQSVVPTGAILADEMGMGKSLTCLAIVWAIVGRGAGKGVIVCPFSLISNWCDEIKKWFPSTLGRTALFIKHTGANDTVGQFIHSHSAAHPLLVLSYEMFRNFSDVINATPFLSIIVCDEGHRLKNAYGTKTMSALASSPCRRRLVLTGTPIQNNLMELFAVVDFACPGYLGTINEFRETFMNPIENSRKQGASSAMLEMKRATVAELRRKLALILLRRTRSDVMAAILPPCNLMRVHCPLSALQEEQYNAETDSLLSNLAGATSDTVLPALMRLRMICNNADDQYVSTTITSSSIPMTSIKLSVLEHMLKVIFSRDTKGDVDGEKTTSVNSDRVVIVSNFTSMLDHVQVLLRTYSWLHFRIDGSTQGELRQKMVNKFNAANSPFVAMLLSTKAGGVGLNLTGANRLFMLDPDWNPSTDQQAMGRVWRDGQTKPVFIYRLTCLRTIEDSIMIRQANKYSLSAVIQKTGKGDSSTTARDLGEGDMGTDFYKDPDNDPGTEALPSAVEAEVIGAGVNSVGLIALLRPPSINIPISKRSGSASVTSNTVDMECHVVLLEDIESPSVDPVVASLRETNVKSLVCTSRNDTLYFQHRSTK